MPRLRRGVSPCPAWCSPSIWHLPSTMGASDAARDHRAGLSSPPCRSPPCRPRTCPAPGGIWGPGEDRVGGVRVRHGTPQFIPPSGVPIRGTPLPPLSGSLCQRARGNTRPGPSRATLWGHEHQLGHHVWPPATGPPCREGTQKKPAPISAVSGSARRPTAHPALHVGIPNLGLTIRSPHNGDKHRGRHKDIEEREPPAKEQQVEDVSTRHRGPCRMGGTGWDRYHLQQPESTLPPQRVVPRATHLQSPG